MFLLRGQGSWSPGSILSLYKAVIFLGEIFILYVQHKLSAVTDKILQCADHLGGQRPLVLEDNPLIIEYLTERFFLSSVL